MEAIYRKAHENNGRGSVFQMTARAAVKQGYKQRLRALDCYFTERSRKIGELVWIFRTVKRLAQVRRHRGAIFKIRETTYGLETEKYCERVSNNIFKEQIVCRSSDEWLEEATRGSDGLLSD